jgi:nitrate reductase gamma subunit
MKSPNFTYLIIGAVIMALLPFGETPHLWQKLLLLERWLSTPADGLV